MHEPVAKSSAKPTKLGLAVAVLTLSMMAAAGMRLIFSPVQEVVKASLRLTDLQISLVQGLAAATTIAVVSLPLGRITDRTNRLFLLGILGGVSVFGTALTAFASDFRLLFLARMLATTGGACSLPVAISFLADLAPADRRGRSMIFIQIGQMAGAAVAFAIGGSLLGRLQPTVLPILGSTSVWQQILLIFTVIGGVSLLTLFLLKEPPRHEIATNVHISLRRAVAIIWDLRGYVIPLYLGQLTVVMADSAAGIWAVPVLVRTFKLQPAQFGGWLGLIIFGSGIIGATIGGLSADLGRKRRLPGGTLVGAVVAALCAIPASLFAITPDVQMFAIAFGIFLVCGSITSIVTATAIAVYVPNEVRGLCLSMFIVIGAVGGLGVAPTLVPVLSTYWGGEQGIGQALAAVSTVTSITAFFGFVVAARRQRDIHPADAATTNEN